MRVTLYNEPSGNALGGTERSVAILAQALTPKYSVEIVHHRPWLSPRMLEEFSGTNLDGVRLRAAPIEPQPLGNSHLPWRRYGETRAWHRGLSRNCDLFVNFTHGIPPFCHAPRGVLFVLFPMFTPYHLTPDASRDRRVWPMVRSAYSSFEWQRRLASYSVVTAISEYTRTWVRQLWGCEAEIVHPPVDSFPAHADKRPMILSVGRFATSGHRKCQVEMVNAFKQLTLPGWRYATVGPVGKERADGAFFDAVQHLAEGSPITVQANVPRQELGELYDRAAIFWHAAGLDNLENTPELNEHFGMSTVEAMAAGCVPVVINKGGQPEVVEHGTSGFVWNTADELLRYTTLLANDDTLRLRMAAAARQRASRFDRQHYVDRFLGLLEGETRPPLATTDQLPAVAG